MSIESLIESIQVDDCVCLVGPSVFGSDCQTNLLSELSAHLRQSKPEFFDANEDYEDIDFFIIAEHFVNSPGGGIALLLREVREFLASDRGTELQNSRLLSIIATLPVSHYVYFGFDTFLLRALEAQGRKPVARHYPLGEMQSVSETISPQRPLVFNLFGNIDPGNGHPLITESQLLASLPVLSGDTPSWPRNTISKIRSPHVASLFVGIGFHRWYNRFLIGVYGGDTKHRLDSVAFESGAFFQSKTQRREVMFFLDNAQNRVHFFDITRSNAQTWERLGDVEWNTGQAAAAEAGGQANPDASTVFVSYAHQDLDLARQLAGAFRQRGVSIRCDAQLAESPDEQVVVGDFLADLKQQQGSIDYFVVLLTDFVKHNQTHVANELAAAQNMKQYVDKQFIVPVRENERVQPLRKVSEHHFNWDSEAERTVLMQKIASREL